MFQIAALLLSIFLLVNFCQVKDIYDMEVDELFSAMIGPVYKVKNTPHTFKFMNVTAKSRTKGRMNNQHFENTTAKNDYFVTPHEQMRRIEGESAVTKRELEFEALVQHSPEKPIPDFNVDPFKTLSRRFDSIRRQFTQYRSKQTLREEYFKYEYKELIKLEKKRLLAIMEQFVYESRYKMTYGQRLRKKYKRRVGYQLGYCFALLRNLKQQQYVIYSTMDSNYRSYTSFYTFIKMYERIVRLDIDLKDLIKFIKYLDYMTSFQNLTDRT